MLKNPCLHWIISSARQQPTSESCEVKQFFSEQMTKFLTLKCKKFPNCLRLNTITRFSQQEAPLSKNNYQPVSTLSIISKIFERVTCSQIWTYFDDISLRFQYAFRKGYSYSAQHCLLMLELQKEAKDKSKAFGAFTAQKMKFSIKYFFIFCVVIENKSKAKGYGDDR